MEKSFRKHGYPLLGSGLLTGIVWKEGILYADVMITSRYNEHIKIECLKNGQYKKGGHILFPPTPSFETVEKREKYLQKKYRHLAER